MSRISPFFPFLLGAMIFACPQSEAAGKESSLPARQDIPSEYKWQLTDIYSNDDLWQNDFDKIKASLPQISSYKGRLTTSAADLLACLQLRDELNILKGKIFAYARMHRDENTSDSRYQAMTSKAEGLIAESGAATAYIQPDLLTMSEDTWLAFRKLEPKLSIYTFYMENLFRQRKHVLSPAEEQILAGMSELARSSANTFTMLSRADMKFPQMQDESGLLVQLSEGRYRSFIMSENRQVRKDAFEKMFATYAQYRNTMASTLAGNVKKNQFYAKTRKYSSSLEAALESDNIPVDVYDNLIKTVNEHLQPLHRYVSLKKRILQLDEMHMYDLYTPIIRGVEVKIKYSEAKELIRKGLSPLGEEYGKLIDKGLDSSWIDVYESQGKQSGGYSWGVYGVHPFILLNYNDRLDDAMTLAHEMGHALHSYKSNSSQPYINSHYTIFSAEVASITNETLMMDYLLKTTTDHKQRLYLINQYLESVRTTLYRQTMFAEFEKILYSKAESGEAITPDLLDNIWHELNVKYFGPDMIVDKTIDAEWSRIPHFYYDFYVFQYATGFSAANALASGLLQGNESTRTRYLEFLNSGGSDYSISLLKKAGVDMSSPKPIEITLIRFNEMLDELERLLQNS